MWGRTVPCMFSKILIWLDEQHASVGSTCFTKSIQHVSEGLQEPLNNLRHESLLVFFSETEEKKVVLQ